MANEKKKFVKILTPKGVLKWPHLQKADTKFSAEGVFKTAIRLERSVCEELLAALDKVADDAVEAANADAAAKGKKDKRTNKPISFERHVPYATDFGEDGEDSGFVIINFKTKKRPEIVDSRGKDITKICPPVWSGTVAKISGSATDFIADASKMAGVSLFLNKVMIVDLKSGGGDDIAPEEDGFTAEEISHVEAPSDEVKAAQGDDSDF